jgi:Leucine-rich repeat (LRR) protein
MQSLPRLELLDVARNALTSLRGLESLTNLQALRASHNPLGSLPCLTALTRLTELSLSSCPLSSLRTADVIEDGDDVSREAAGAGSAAARGCALPAGLRRLSLARCAFPTAAAACAPLGALAALKGLSLAGNPFTAAAALAPGDTYRPAALVHCPLALRALDCDPVSALRPCAPFNPLPAWTLLLAQ